MDESQNLEELQPFTAVFQLVESKESSSKTIDKKINHVIGRGNMMFNVTSIRLLKIT